MCINHVGLLDSRAGRTYKISNNFLVLAHAWAALKYKIPYLNGSSVVEWAAEKKMILSVVDKYMNGFYYRMFLRNARGQRLGCSKNCEHEGNKKGIVASTKLSFGIIFVMEIPEFLDKSQKDISVFVAKLFLLRHRSLQ